MLSLHICLTFVVFILCYPVFLSLARVLSFVLSLKQPRPGMGPAAAGCRHRRRRHRQTSLRSKMSARNRCGSFCTKRNTRDVLYCLWHDHVWGYIMSWWYNVCIYNWQFRGTTPRQRLKPNSITVGNMTWFAGYQVWSQFPKLVAITFDGLEQPWLFSKKWVVYNRPTSYNQQ